MRRCILNGTGVPVYEVSAYCQSDSRTRQDGGVGGDDGSSWSVRGVTPAVTGGGREFAWRALNVWANRFTRRREKAKAARIQDGLRTCQTPPEDVSAYEQRSQLSF